MPLAFQLFGPAHLAALALIVILPLALALAVRRWPSSGLDRGVANTAAAVLILNKIAVLILSHKQGALDLQNALPMHLCDWATIATILALVGRWQLPYEMAYFWGLAGTLQAILTPDIEGDFSDLAVMLFFVAHGGVIASVLYLTLGLRMRPRRGSVLRIFAWTLVYAVATGAVNALVGANYGYLRAKPEHPSLLDHLGPWPIYIASMMVLACALFSVLYGPFLVADKIRKPGAGAAPSP
ncbi:MAG TPA: TIGR02206 family membrane protein [Terrimicrobiaceae bacterium]